MACKLICGSGAARTDQGLRGALRQQSVGRRQRCVRIRVLEQRPLQLGRLVQQPPVVTRLRIGSTAQGGDACEGL